MPKSENPRKKRTPPVQPDAPSLEDAIRARAYQLWNVSGSGASAAAKARPNDGKKKATKTRRGETRKPR